MQKKMLSELITQLVKIYAANGDLPVYGETVDGPQDGQVLVNTRLNNVTERKKVAVILEIEEPNPGFYPLCDICEEQVDEETYPPCESVVLCGKTECWDVHSQNCDQIEC